MKPLLCFFILAAVSTAIKISQRTQLPPNESLEYI